MVEEVLARHPDAAFVSNLEDRSRVGSLGPAVERPKSTSFYRLRHPRRARLRFAPSEDIGSSIGRSPRSCRGRGAT